MKGNLSFLLVLASVSIFLILINANFNSQSVNFSKAIALERTEQLSLDAKRSMLAAAKYGAVAGFLEYLAEIAASGGTEAFNPNEAKQRIRAGAISSILLLDLEDEDYSFYAWCRETGSESELDELAGKILMEKNPASCSSCKPLYLCPDAIDVEIRSNSSFANLALGSQNLGKKPMIFGISVYSEKFGISKVSYIPTSEKLFEVPYSLS